MGGTMLYESIKAAHALSITLAHLKGLLKSYQNQLWNTGELTTEPTYISTHLFHRATKLVAFYFDPSEIQETSRTDTS